MKKTPLYNKHLALGAKMVDFAGYLMPVSYTTITEEHMAVRNQCGLFDVSHMGEFIVEGQNALDFLQSILSNDISKIEIGDAQYNCMPNDNGGIVDDLIVYRLEKDKYLLVVNASNEEKDWNWIQTKNQSFQCELVNQSDEWALLALQGPNAVQIAQSLTKINLDEIGFYHFEVGDIADIKDVIISATGYTGSGGFEFYVKNSNAEKLWDALMTAGSELGLQPCGLGARDTLRLEMGYCLYGNDIDDTTSPLEAGLGWITKLKAKSFSSSEIFQKEKEEGIRRKLIGLLLDSKRIARSGSTIINERGEEVGKVTSGGLSPILGKPIALGYVAVESTQSGEELYVQIGNKSVPAEKTRPPFVEV